MNEEISIDYKMDMNSTKKDLDKIYEKLYSITYSYEKLDNYLLVDIVKLYKKYKNNIVNYNYFNIISLLFYSYLNYYDANKYYNLIEYFKNPIYSYNNQNVKKLIRYENVKKDNEYTIIQEYPIEIKTLKNITFESLEEDIKIYKIIPSKKTTFDIQRKDLLHEACVGLILLNNVKKYLPNIPYVFCYNECSRPIIINDDILSWCNVEKNVNNNFPFLYRENIDGITLRDFLNKKSIKEISNVVFQYKNIMNFLNLFLSKYENRNTNLDNIIIKKLNYEINIPIYENIPIETNMYIKTKYILYITDFTDTSIIDIKNDFYGDIRIENIKSDKKNYDYLELLKDVDLTDSKIMNNIEIFNGYINNIHDFPLIYKKKLNYVEYCYENKEPPEEINKKFEEYIRTNIDYFYKVDLENANYIELIKLAEKYNKFLNDLSYSKCFNYINYLDKIIDFYIIIKYYLLKENIIVNYMKESIINTLDINIDRLPTKKLVTFKSAKNLIYSVWQIKERIEIYNLLFFICVNIYNSNYNQDLALNVVELLIEQPEFSFIENLIKDYTIDLSNYLLSSYIAGNYSFLIYILILLKPNIIKNVYNLWDLSFFVYDSTSKIINLKKYLDNYYNLFKNKTDQQSWEYMLSNKKNIVKYDILEKVKNKKNDVNILVSELMAKIILLSEDQQQNLIEIIKSNLKEDEKIKLIDRILL